MSPTPFTLLCALLLSLPLALLFTTSTAPVDTATTIPTTTTTNANNNHPNQLQKPINSATPILPPALAPLPSLTTPPPLSHAHDNEDDKTLCRLASRVNSEAGSPSKLAFLFLTVSPLPLAPLWELFFDQANKNLYNIYIHADPSFNYDPPFTGVFFNRTIPSKRTQRHFPSLGAAHRRLLARALLDDPANYMFAIISPSCIPLHSFSFTYKYLIGSRKSFIQILKYRHGSYRRWVARGEHAMLPDVKLGSFRVGSQFSVLTRGHARAVVNDTRVWSKFNQPCVQERMNHCYPEENYFPTLIHMGDPRGYVPATVTHVDWHDEHKGHPHTYHAPEVRPELIFKLRSDKPGYGDDGNNTNGEDRDIFQAMEGELLPPGYRFHPTDTELLDYYLKRKVMGLPFHFEAISELDLYKFSPWDLPEKSPCQMNQSEWYFFCPRNRKNAFTSRVNRANEIGYWKVSGRDRPIIVNDNQILGMKKILVFYIGRAPRGERTNWVMHEYRLQTKHVNNELLLQDSYVLCRVFQKGSLGPRNGTPFAEEEVDHYANEVTSNDNAILSSLPCYEPNLQGLMGREESKLPSLTDEARECTMPICQNDKNKLSWGFLNQDKNAIEAVQNPNDLKIYEGLDDLSIQAELNVADSYLLLKSPVSEFQMWLPGNVDTPFFGQNDLQYNSINYTDYGSNGTSIFPANGFSAPSVTNSMLQPALMANQEEGSHWFDDLLATSPQETNGFGGSINAENANGATLEGLLQSFWDCVPARSASAMEQPGQTKISHASMAKKTRKSTGNMLLSKHYKFPSITWKHKNFKKTTTSSRGTKFGFVYGLALLALAMWFSLLMVTAKLGCFMWKLILS